ncbi:hypothetical protein Sango_0263100 [Sesamum angolense]|uniref:DUF8040 domain-containing protein n=1 Tax=Sesamum angolense TaxID=2727404 RepID=A0AAE1XI38_9LAMI|nr:hypothetical protein Sango_0263100 [Sesamum angolense]
MDTWPCARVLGPPLFRTKAMIPVSVQHLGFIYLGQADVVQIWGLDNRWCSGRIMLKEYIGRKRMRHSRRVLALITLQQIVDEVVVALTICIQVLEYIKTRTTSSGRFRHRRYSLTTRMPDQVGRLYRLVSSNDKTCLRNLRMDRNAFGRLCYMLEQSGGVRPTKNVSVPEQVAMFLSVLSHHKKNCVVKHDFIRSGRTVSKHFHVVLHAVCKMQKFLLAKPTSIVDDCSDTRWNGSSGWEGSAADSRVLRDAIHRPNGLRVPTGNYYLCDNGYANADGFLTPYRGVRYHLREWDRTAGGPQNKEELFYLKHSSTRNVIEKNFRIAKSAMDADFFSTANVNTLDDDGSSQQKRRGNNKDRSGPRRTWSLVEEEALINGLKSLVSSGWKCDNGFRNGYLAQLEAHLKRAFPQCDLEAEPHINSKLHIDPSAKGMRVATEKTGRELTDAQQCYTPTGDWNPDTGFHGINEELPQSNNNNCDPTVDSSSATKRTTSGRKRKVDDPCSEIPQLVNMVSNFCETANNRIGSLTRVWKVSLVIPINVGW